MKKVLDNVWDFLCSLGQARYAAELARNGKIAEARRIYESV